MQKQPAETHIASNPYADPERCACNDSDVYDGYAVCSLHPEED